MKWLALVIMATLASSAAKAAPCASDAPDKAIAALSAAKDWEGLHSFYLAYKSCDDGGVADDVTERVVKLLTGNWGQLDRLAKQLAAQDGFKDFVLTHIDSTADTQDLRTVRRLAGGKCPGDLRPLCASLQKAAARALQ